MRKILSNISVCGLALGLLAMGIVQMGFTI